MNEVDRFIDALGQAWQRRACTQLIEDVRDAARLGEHIKWGNPYFDLDGAAVIKWFCAKNWINVYFFRGRELPDPQGLFEHSTNSRMLLLRVTPDGSLDRSAFRDLIRAAVTLARTDVQGDHGGTQPSDQ